MPSKYEVYEGEPDDAGQRWRWRLVADNGEEVASGEAYSTKADAERGAADAANVSREAVEGGGEA